jgi:beta-glucosidase
LYPFGYGLSYTRFTYDNLIIPANTKKGKPLVVRVKVTNTGSSDGEEVVQLYLSHLQKQIRVPLKALKGFQRIALKAGEAKTVTFQLSTEDLSIVNKDGKLYQPSGSVQVSVGGGQPGVSNKTSSNVVSKSINIQ